MAIRNRTELLSKGLVEGRRTVLDIIDETLSRVNYHNLVHGIVGLRGEVLRIKELELDLARYDNIRLIGGGKNASFMALALEDILGDRIRSGIIIEKRGFKGKKTRMPIIEGGHPIPDQDSVRGAEGIIKIAETAGEKDLLIVCVSGGWTALASAPPEGVPLQDFSEAYELLLKSGMTLTQMNVIRYHLSRLGKGKIPMLTHGATVLGLIAVDEVLGRPWGPTVPDNATFSDALTILRQFDLLSSMPRTVREYLERAEPSEETPKEQDYSEKALRVHNIVIADGTALCETALEVAKKRMDTYILTTTLEGEARDVGTVLASIANEISEHHRPFSPPCILLVGGETTVTITGDAGEGGRNQELALSAALNIRDTSNIVISSVGTDGTDGPTDIAGAIVDYTTAQRAKDKGIDVLEELRNHNSSPVFRRLGEAIFTRDTGTNLMDIIVIYVGI